MNTVTLKNIKLRRAKDCPVWIDVTINAPMEEADVEDLYPSEVDMTAYFNGPAGSSVSLGGSQWKFDVDFIGETTSKIGTLKECHIKKTKITRGKGDNEGETTVEIELAAMQTCNPKILNDLVNDLKNRVRVRFNRQQVDIEDGDK